MSEDNYVNEQALIEAFKTLWGKYPEPAMLIKRGKRVMALNWACRQAGAKIGSYCHEIGGQCQEAKKNCLLNPCLDQGRAIHIKVNTGKERWSIHWVPIEGHPDYCLHFFAGSVEEASGLI